MSFREFTVLYATGQPKVQWAATIFLLLALITCVNPATPQADKLFGDWEKQDGSLPPIDLTLSSDDSYILARLRQSGVELIGTAIVDRSQIRLMFPNRRGITGELLSKSDINLRLEPNSEAFRLTTTE